MNKNRENIIEMWKNRKKILEKKKNQKKMCSIKFNFWTKIDLLLKCVLCSAIPSYFILISDSFIFWKVKKTEISGKNELQDCQKNC